MIKKCAAALGLAVILSVVISAPANADPVVHANLDLNGQVGNLDFNMPITINIDV